MATPHGKSSLRSTVTSERSKATTGRSPVFWGTVTALAARAGVDPILLVPWGQATALQGWVYRMGEEEKARYGFSGNNRELGGQALFRCGTVAVIRSEVPAPLLVSNRKIQRQRFLSTGTGSRFIEVAFRHRRDEAEEAEAGLPTTEGVTFDCRLEIDWSEGPVYELRFAAPAPRRALSGRRHRSVDGVWRGRRLSKLRLPLCTIIA